MTYSGRTEQEKQNKRMEIRLPESELAAVERAAGKNKSEWAREAFRLRLCGPLTTGTTAETPFPPDHNMGVGRVPGAGNGIMGGSIGREAEATQRVNAPVMPLRASSSQVEAGPSEAMDATSREQAGSASVPSGDQTEGVRPAVQSQIPRGGHVLGDVDLTHPHVRSKPLRVDAEAKPERITQPVEPQISRSAQRMQAVTGRPVPHLPKCVCAMCKPPKTGKGKK